MRTNRKLLSGIAILAAVFVFMGIYSLLNNRNATPPPAQNAAPLVPVSDDSAVAPGSVVFVRGRIPARAIITPDMIQMKKNPTPGGPAENFIGTPNDIVGYITRVPLDTKNPVNPRDLVGHISEVGIAGALQPGMRAMVLPVPSKPTLHDLTLVGNYVDIIAAFEGQESRTIVENVRILAVDVFGKQFPQANIATGGPYKADPKGHGTASTPAAPGAPGAVPGDPNAAPTATPAPNNQPPPPRPDPAFTLEVTPQQANTIALALNAGGSLDILLRPAPPIGVESAPITAPDGTPVQTVLTNVSVTKPQIAPYATRIKSGGGNGTGSNRGTNAGTRIAGNPRSPEPTFGPPPGEHGPVVGPATFNAPTNAPTTYEIPVYADGKLSRVDTVPLPQKR